MGRQKKQAVGGVTVAVLLLVAAAYANAPARLLWVVKAGEDVDKTHAERVYFEACQWIEKQLEAARTVRPKLTVHVGEACPQSQIEGACMNPALGELYLPKWDENAPRAVAEATLATALHDLLQEKQNRKSAMHLAYGGTLPKHVNEVAR